MPKSKPQLKIYFILTLVVFVLGFNMTPVFAAEISFNSKASEVAVGQQFQVDMSLNAGGEEINAIEGKIIFPGDILELKEIRDVNSIINFWVDKPKLESDSQISFSGITPGGYQEGKGLLLSLVFLSKKEGRGVVKLHEAKALLNDGKGTEASLSISSYQFIVSQIVSALPPATIIDKEPPESFVPEIASNPSIFGGKWFLVFTTQDKGTGIDHYEVKESRQRILGVFSKWISTESPYVLEDQELKSYIFVKALDKAGNERIIDILPENPLHWYENWLIIVVGFVVIFSVIKKFLWRKHIKI